MRALPSIQARYLVTDKPTGKCAVLVCDSERSLVAQLGAAEHYKVRPRSQPADSPTPRRQLFA